MITDSKTSLGFAEYLSVSYAFIICSRQKTAFSVPNFEACPRICSRSKSPASISFAESGDDAEETEDEEAQKHLHDRFHGADHVSRRLVRADHIAVDETRNGKEDEDERSANIVGVEHHPIVGERRNIHNEAGKIHCEQ